MAKKNSATPIVEKIAPSRVKGKVEVKGKTEEQAQAKPKTQAKKAPPMDPAQFDDMVAKAAYFNAEKRGFAPGYEMQDWLQAEQQIAASLARR